MSYTNPSVNSQSKPDLQAEISEPSTSKALGLTEAEVPDTSHFNTFPTHQVPQSVKRDTITDKTTEMAALTDKSGSACLPQSAPTVQAQVSSTGCASCDDCSHVNLKEHNQVEPQLRDSRTGQETGAGPLARSPADRQVGDLSVIISSSCTTVSSPYLTKRQDGTGNAKIKLDNKMQSVNVTSRVNNCISNKGNDYGLLMSDGCEFAVTVPKMKPQRNTGSRTEASNNNSVKLIIKENGALNLLQKMSCAESQNQCRSKNIPEGDIPITTTTVTEEKAVQLLTKSDQTTTTTTNTCTANEGDGYVSFDRLVALTKRTRELMRQGYVFKLGLCGGGENSLNTGTSGWGTPPSAGAGSGSGASGWSGNGSGGQQQWNNAGRANPPAAQDGNSNKANTSTSNLQSGSSATSQPNNQGNPVPAVQAGSSNTTKQQLEQLNNMREALFSQDGWGGQHVNQDTNWDIPSSPEPSMKMDSGGPPQWKPNVNNGTELWEANLRNGGQPPPQPVQKAPWGHTPSTNIGGTWGEDDDAADSSNVWTGPPGTAAVNTGQQWTAQGGAAAGPKKDSEWSGNSVWNDPRATDPRTSGGALDLRDIRLDPRTTVPALDPRDQMRLVGGDMRGDPRGITGRLSGPTAADPMWNPQHPQVGGLHMHQPKMMAPTGWEEPSPPSQRRNVPNYDDGTSLWGNPNQQPSRMAGVSSGNLSHWKELPTGPSVGRGAAGAGSMGCPPGMAQSRVKPDGSVWAHGGAARNGSWEEGTPAWDEGAAPWPGPVKPKPEGQLWDTTADMDWGHKPKQQLTKDFIWNSKQFRLLCDMGYKKESVEAALRARDMNMDDALEILGSHMRPDGWRGRHDDHFDHQAAGQFSGQRFGPGVPSTQMSFPPAGNGSNLLHSASSGNPTLASINNMSPAVVHKMLNQAGSTQGFSNGARAVPPQSQPSHQQLRMLVQQIQMAVQAGYLNHQILNQPLAPNTLLLLNQLLQHIKTLQQLTNQLSLLQTQAPPGGKQNQMTVQYQIFINKAKQQIHSLQQQIANQQAVYIKQQQPQLSGANSAANADFFKPNVHDTVGSLQGNFSDLTIAKEPQVSTQQSRLNQWKLPSVDKDTDNEFSRAPGSVAKPLVSSHSSPNMTQLGLSQADGPWSTGRTGDSGGWPDTGNADVQSDGNKDWSSQAATPLTDLVPEFEPGKPWKGTQIKSIEDDPSITPGSVARSPLSIVSIKDSEIFNTGVVAPSKVSPPGGDSGLQPLSLGSSTWTFNPPGTSPLSKLAQTKGAWGEGAPPTITSGAELWGAPANKSRGPPPGLAKGGSVSSIAANGWRGSNNWGSPWLFLRNLTAQIDGSTLRTLCMQHGPLQCFHLYLHNGFALAKYSTRDEATKAQQALNNCVLGNTTILAECPSETDANALIQQIAPQQSASASAWRGSTAKPPGQADTWNTGWPQTAAASSLWGTGDDQARATPSSLNSFLPGDLLGGESM